MKHFTGRSAVLVGAMSAGLLVTGAAGAAPAPGAYAAVQASAAVGSVAQSSAAACAGVYFIGARGSGENGKDFRHFHGLGPEVARMDSVLTSVLRRHHITVKTLPDPFEADSVIADLKPTAKEIKQFFSAWAKAIIHYYRHNVEKFLASISDGAKDAVLLAQGEHRLCPHALLIMAGYSQGAMAIHQAELQLAADHDAGVLKQIAATLLVADGDQVKDSKVAQRYGTAPATATGIRAWFLPHIGQSGKDVLQPMTTASICTAGDIVCNFALPRARSPRAFLAAINAAIKVHLSYARKGKTGNWNYDPALAISATWAAQLIATSIGGDWEGRYTCSQGLTGLDLKITRSGPMLLARFSFYPLVSNPTVPVGIYTMRGTYRSASKIVLRERRWILHPPGYAMVGLSGSLSRGRFRGRVHGQLCTTFSLTKPTGHPRRSDVVGTWTGSYFGCSQGPTGLRLVVRRSGSTGDKLNAKFSFYALKSNPGGPSGSYAMSGYYFPGGVALDGTHWIHQPPGYGMVNLVGNPPRRNGRTFRGAIVDCTTFSLERH